QRGARQHRSEGARAGIVEELRERDILAPARRHLLLHLHGCERAPSEPKEVVLWTNTVEPELVLEQRRELRFEPGLEAAASSPGALDSWLGQRLDVDLAV